MKSIKKQYLFYLLFALFALMLNIITQKTVAILFYSFNNDFFTTIIYKNIDITTISKILIATGVSFFFKYFLDKHIVFSVTAKNSSKTSNLTTIALYGGFAILTTILAWVVQISFKIFLHQEYLGLVIGLSAGYSIKFFLDKNHVFVDERL